MTEIINMKSGAVALLDILGWKGIWKQDEDALHKLYMLNNQKRYLVF